MVRQLNKGSLLLLALLLAIAGVTTWLRTRPDLTTPATGKDAIRQIDFFMEDFNIRQYDKQGQLHYTLEGRQLNHFQQDSRTEISKPDLELNRQDNRWTVQAEQAITTEAAEEIRFFGNVRAEQTGTMLIRTEALLLRPETEYLETLEPVVISGTGGNIDALSLGANLKTGIHTLSGVKGRYAP